MSDANRVRLTYVEESSFGVPPGSPSTTAIRYTGESLVSSRETTESQEIRDDRQVADLIEVGIGAGGGIDVEQSQGAFDDFIIAALQAASWSTPETVTGVTISADDADNSINDSANGFGGYTADKWIRISGFTEAANNGYAKIVSVAAGKLVLSHITLVTEAAGDSLSVVQGAYIENGTTKRSFALERGWLDKGKYELFTGMNVGSWALNFQVRQILTGSFGFTGKTTSFASSSIDSSPTAAPTKEVNNAVRHVKLIAVDGTPLSLLRQFSMTLNNNLRSLDAIGQLGAFEVGSGRISVTGSI
ncbi:MAG: phage tail tube protein, partial [Solirubrobacterales bacterium]